MNQRRISLLACIVFCLLISSLAAYDLKHSYRQLEQNTEEQLAGISLLLSEWVHGAFTTSDYILRDIIYSVPVAALQYPAPDPDQQAAITRLLRDKRNTFAKANGIGLNDRHCRITHTLGPIGFDASDRDWCRIPRQNPAMETYVSNMFISHQGVPTVIQVRKFPGPEFSGMAGMSFSLDFFSHWLDDLDDQGDYPFDTITILDMNMTLLARKPAIVDKIGTEIYEPQVAAFLRTEGLVKTFHLVSPIDGESRLFNVRKMDTLPFVAIVGRSDHQWQKPWLQRLTVSLAALLILWTLTLVALRSYWARLDNLAELEKIRDELQILSITDALTGLANRRQLDTTLDNEYRRLRRTHAPLSAIMIDIDFFKSFNDHYGHTEGDRCLQSVAKAIIGGVRRPSDLASRYGGEEFCCILPDCDAAAARQVAHNIRKNIERLQIPHEQSLVADHLTASFGVATIRCDDTTGPRQLIKMADDRLYRAKEHGRNQICDSDTAATDTEQPGSPA